MFRPSAGLDLSRLTESEQQYFQVFQDIYEHGQTPGGAVLGELMTAGHITTYENDLLRMTDSGTRLFEYLQQKATTDAGRLAN